MLRRAVLGDAQQIYKLINLGAKKKFLLPRSLNYVFEHLTNFWVFSDKGKIIGCCALSVVGWEGLAEIKSLMVARGYRRKNIGSKLVKKCLQEAKKIQVKKVFVLTFVPKFFEKLKFKPISRNQLPHKIWSDCIDCPYFPNCREEALIFSLEKK